MHLYPRAMICFLLFKTMWLSARSCHPRSLICDLEQAIFRPYSYEQIPSRYKQPLLSDDKSMRTFYLCSVSQSGLWKMVSKQQQWKAEPVESDGQ